MTGFHAWGQWHRRKDTGDGFWHNQPHPNLHVQFLGIHAENGNGMPHAGEAMVPANNFKAQLEGTSAFRINEVQRGADGVLSSLPMNRFVVFRGNSVAGALHGMELGSTGAGVSDVLAEGNHFHDILTQPSIVVPVSATGRVVVRANTDVNSTSAPAALF